MRSKGSWMKATERSNSFEPRNLREAVRKLERLETSLFGAGSGEATHGKDGVKPKERPGILRRWWRWIMGA